MGHPAFRTVKQRTAYIAGLMEQGLWVPYRTARELAAAWSLALSTIRDYSANASHGLSLGMDAADRAAAASRNWERLDAVYDLATQGDANGKLALRAAVSAIELQAKLAGLLDPAQQAARREVPRIEFVVAADESAATKPDEGEESG